MTTRTGPTEQATSGVAAGAIRVGMPGYRRCVACIMDTTDPAIAFDAEGKCSHCRKVARILTRWSPAGDQRALEQMLDRIKREGRGRPYDAACGLSGGVDSSYLVYLAKAWGLRVLLVHVDTGWNSELAVSNVENLVRTTGFDLATHVVDWEEMQDLQLAFFRAAVPNQDVPQDHAIQAAFFAMAARFDVRWSLSGFNMSTECVLPQAWGYDAMDRKHLRAIHARFGTRPLRRYPTMSYPRFHLWHRVIRGMRTARPLNLLPYRKEEAMRILEAGAGWRYYGGKHYESRFTKFFQGWYLPTRWGYDKRLAHLSSLVLTGQLSRAEALREFDEGRLPIEEAEADRYYMANKLGISLEEFDRVMDAPGVPHERYPQTGARYKNELSRLSYLADRFRGQA